MTCIATDGKTIAADSLSICGGAKHRVSKLFRRGDWLIGVAGQAGGASAMLDWIEAGCRLADRPSFQTTDDWCSALCLHRDGSVWVVEKHGMFKVNAPTAIGSGQDFALAAMHLGYSPEAAVGVACSLSSSCGLPVETMEHRSTLREGLITADKVMQRPASFAAPCDCDPLSLYPEKACGRCGRPSR